MSVTMIFWTEIAGGGCGGSSRALYAGRPPTLGSVQHEAYCQLAYQLFFDSPLPPPLLLLSTMSRHSQAQLRRMVLLGANQPDRKAMGWL